MFNIHYVIPIIIKNPKPLSPEVKETLLIIIVIAIIEQIIKLIIKIIKGEIFNV